MAEEVTTTQRDRVLWIRLNRPEARNALSGRLLAGLHAVLQEASTAPDVRVLVITGEGPAFCAGGDVKEMRAMVAGATPSVIAGRALVQRFHRVIAAIHDIEKPVIAGVNGPAYGAGCNVALCCDMRIASEQASFCWGFVNRGLTSDGGSTFLLQRLVGYSKAFELLTLGDTLDAQQSLDLGLVNQVVPHDQLASAIETLAARFAEGPPNAIGMMKRGLHAGGAASFQEALDNEANLQALSMGGTEFLEGIASFIEKRKPNF